MSYKRHTGGTKEFVYTREDLKRIENEDTPHTKEFKEKLKEHYEHRGNEPPKKQPTKEPDAKISHKHPEKEPNRPKKYSVHTILTEFFNSTLNQISLLYPDSLTKGVWIEGVYHVSSGKRHSYDDISSLMKEYRRSFERRYVEYLSKDDIFHETKILIKFIGQIASATDEKRSEVYSLVNELLKKMRREFDDYRYERLELFIPKRHQPNEEDEGDSGGIEEVIDVVKPTRDEPKSRFKKWLVLGVILLLILVIFLYLGTRYETELVSKNITSTASVENFESITDSISFSSYLGGYLCLGRAGSYLARSIKAEY